MATNLNITISFFFFFQRTTAVRRHFEVIIRVASFGRVGTMALLEALSDQPGSAAKALGAVVLNHNGLVALHQWLSFV